MFILVLVMLLIVSVFVCHFLAKKRGANAVFWGVMGGVFGPFTIPFVFFSKRDDK